MIFGGEDNVLPWADPLMQFHCAESAESPVCRFEAQLDLRAFSQQLAFSAGSGLCPSDHRLWRVQKRYGSILPCLTAHRCARSSSFVQWLGEKTVWVLSLGDLLSERALEIGVEKSDWPM